MVLLHPTDSKPLRSSRGLGVGVAGADSNFAIAMTRLGWPAIWLSAVSEDPLGDLLVEMVGGGGVGVSRGRRDPDHRTGVFFKVRQEGHTRVIYYRRGSAASHFDPDWLPPSPFQTAGLPHPHWGTRALGASPGAG